MWLRKMAADPAIETEVIKRRKRPDFVTRDHGSQLPGHESGEYVQRQGCPLPLPDRRSCQQSSAQNAREAPRNAEPSGAAKTPSTRAHSRSASIISLSVTARAMPALFLRISRIR